MINSDKFENKELIEKIGKRICILRKKKGFSRERLAFKIGICHQQLFKYEVGENRITVDRLIAIAEALNTKIINFFPLDDVGEKIGIPTLNDNTDYRLLGHLFKLKKLSGEDLAIKFIELLVCEIKS